MCLRRKIKIVPKKYGGVKYMINEAKAFFKNYNTTFDSGDMFEFSKLFHEPFISARPDGSIAHMPTNEIAKEFFTKAQTSWEAEGCKYMSTKNYDVTSIGHNAMLVTLTWVLLNENREQIREWRQSYNLLKSNDQWKVFSSMFHSE